MENPFKAIADLVHDGLSKLHGRVDKGEAAVAKVEGDVEAFKEGLEARVSRLEAMLSPASVDAAVDKLKSLPSASPSAPAA